MSTKQVIIFGPTGNVGSVVALDAHEQGAKVFLAMRDPKKPIPCLSLDEEQKGGFERVQADLTKPETITAAVKKTGATRAFIYRVSGNMKSSIVALKSAGIEYVVFLSSDAISGDIRKVPSSNPIPWSHAQVEVQLDDIFGRDGYAAVRPGMFATNCLWWKSMVRQGEVKIAYPSAAFHYITPEDMGRVSGTLLVRGLQAVHEPEKNVVRICGPELLSFRDAIEMIGKVIGKSI